MKYIDCECGVVLRAEGFEQLHEAVKEHALSHHPALVGKISLTDIKNWAQEE